MEIDSPGIIGGTNLFRAGKDFPRTFGSFELLGHVVYAENDILGRYDGGGTIGR